MREALKYLRDTSREFCHLILNSKYNEVFDKYKYPEVAKIRDAIANANAALSASPRNCDVGTAEEQYRRFELMCINNCGNSCKSCQFSDEDGYSELEECVIKWSQMLYEEVKK